MLDSSGFKNRHWGRFYRDWYTSLMYISARLHSPKNTRRHTHDTIAYQERFAFGSARVSSVVPCPGHPFDSSDFASLRMWRQAATAFDKAKADGLPVTASTYTFAINAMSKGGRCVLVSLRARAQAVRRERE